jgi:hypothetical protein
MNRMTLLAPIFASAALFAACSSNDPAVETDAGEVGGPIAVTQADTHCSAAAGKAPQPVSEASCTLTADPDAGTPEPDKPYGATLQGSEGDDDDCKYHIKWSSTPVRQTTDVTFTVTIDELAGGAPATGADPDIEAFLSDVHPAPNSGAKATATSAGTYTIGPIRFDAAGTWTVRFHVRERCTDVAEDSPHGHGAFFVRVP